MATRKAKKKRPARKPSAKKLTEKQELFAREYVIDRNGKQAAIRAGYAEKGAEVQASKMLRIPKVRDRVRELIAKQFERMDVTTDRIYDEMARVAFSNLSDYVNVDEDGAVVLFPWEDMPREAFAAVSEVSETPGKYGRTRRIRMHDKLGALRDLAKLKGMDPDDTPEEKARRIAEGLRELAAATFIPAPGEA